MKNGLLESYNARDSLLVVATYPRINQKYSREMGGVASFTKNTVKAILRETPGKKVVILTTVISEKEIYEEEDGILVVRCIKKNNFFSYLNLLNYVFRLNNIKKVLIEFELTLFGNLLMTGFTIPLLWFLWLSGKKTTIVIHPVLGDVRKLYGHFGLPRGNRLLYLMNFILNSFYFLIALPSQNIVVLEEKLRERLTNLVGNKVVHISHGVDNAVKNNMDRETARKLLGIEKNEFVVMYFGFLVWYKGVDRLIEVFKDISKINGKKIKLLIAGGPSLTQGKKGHYKDFIATLLADIKSSKNILYTGFVPEKKLRVVYEAADLLVLPHRVFISSSGPLSLAASFRKPVILSSELKEIEKSSDFAKAMRNAYLSEEELFFSFKNRGLVKRVAKAMDPNLLQKLSRFSENLAKERDFRNIVGVYNKIIFEKEAAKLVILPSPAT